MGKVEVRWPCVGGFESATTGGIEKVVTCSAGVSPPVVRIRYGYSGVGVWATKGAWGWTRALRTTAVQGVRQSPGSASQTVGDGTGTDGSSRRPIGRFPWEDEAVASITAVGVAPAAMPRT